MKIRRLLVSALTITGLLLFSGCATQPMSLNYAPSSVMTLTGSVSVADFTYLPAANNTNIKPNQIRNTALGTVLFDRNIDIIIKEAVFKELRFVGVKLDNQNRHLTGEIQEFLIDDLGYSVDWTLRVKYTIKESESGKFVYEAVKNTQRKTSKFGNPFGTLNEIIKANIEDLMKDEAFVGAIKQ